MKGRQLFDGEPTPDLGAGAATPPELAQRVPPPDIRGISERGTGTGPAHRRSGPRLRASASTVTSQKTHFIWWVKVRRHAVEEDEGHSRSERGRPREGRPRRRSSGLETEEEGILHTRPAKVKMQGLRWRLRVRPREEKEAMQGVRRRRDMPTRSSAFTVQGVRRRFDLSARSSAYDVQGMRRRAHLPARQGEVEVQRMRRDIVVFAR